MFSVNEFVLVKRTDGSWSEAKVVFADESLVIVEFELGNTLRGYANPFDKHEIGTKCISVNKFSTHLKKMQRHINSENI